MWIQEDTIGIVIVWDTNAVVVAVSRSDIDRIMFKVPTVEEQS